MLAYIIASVCEIKVFQMKAYLHNDSATKIPYIAIVP